MFVYLTVFEITVVWHEYMIAIYLSMRSKIALFIITGCHGYQNKMLILTNIFKLKIKYYINY